MSEAGPHTDGRHTDVLIVGAGASGGVVARRLAEAGIGVVCLEQGEWPDRSAFRGAEADWELTAPQAVVEPAERPSTRPATTRSTSSDSDVGVVNFNGVGGGMVLYAAQWPRLLPSDFRVRTLDGVADDWPISYEELQPFYERVDAQIGVSGLGGNPAYPPGADPPLPPLPIGRAGLLVARAHTRLGWHWWPDTNAILSAPYDGRHACVQRGTCMQGCGEGAKASTDLTHWPQAIAHGARLVTGARVRRLVTDRRGLVSGRGVDRRGGSRAPADRRPRAVRRQRHRDAAAPARVGVGCVPRRAGQLVGARRAPAHAAPAHHRAGDLRRPPRELAGSEGRVDPVAAVLRDRRGARVRAGRALEHRAARAGRSPTRSRRRHVGRRAPPARCTSASVTPRRGVSSVRTCPTSRTASSCPRPSPTRRASPRRSSCTACPRTRVG